MDENLNNFKRYQERALVDYQNIYWTAWVLVIYSLLVELSFPPTQPLTYLCIILAYSNIFN